MNNVLGDGGSVKVTAAATRVGGDGVLLGDLFGIAYSDAAIGKKLVLERQAEVEAFKKASAAVFAVGDPVRFDVANKEMTDDAQFPVVGKCIKAAGNGVLTVDFVTCTVGHPAPWHSVPCPMVANTTKTYLWSAPFAGTLKGIALQATAAPDSSAGTVTVAFANTNGGDNLISAATFDAEGMSANTRAAMTLTATPADLVFVEGDVVKITVASNNADATGGADLTAFFRVVPN